MDAVFSPYLIPLAPKITMRVGETEDVAATTLLSPACFVSTGLVLLRPKEVNVMFTARQSPNSIIAQGNLLIDVE